jgi:UDP-N-acetylglucosamine 2-epimerase (non-hydrolysing)
VKSCVVIAFGTRPELLKLVSLIQLFDKQKQIPFFIVNANQQANLLNDILTYFKIKPHFTFTASNHQGNLNTLNAHLLNQFNHVFSELKQQFKNIHLLVQGDTATTYCGALSAFHLGIEIGHVEAGLRTFDMQNPFPEEYYRRAVSLMAKHHFAPTSRDKQYLLDEGVPKVNTFVTGNTIIDLVKMVKSKLKLEEGKRQQVLVTFHRRENDIEDLFNLSNGLLLIAKQHPHLDIKWVLHPNKNAQINFIKDIIAEVENIELIKPQPYIDFLTLLAQAICVITDSGGVQEEAYFLNKPTIILRKVTERAAGVDLGFHILASCNPKKLVSNFNKMINTKKISHNNKVYGSGTASKKIFAFTAKYLVNKG